MGVPIKFPGYNRDLWVPGDAGSECPAYQYHDDKGESIFITKWQLTEEEIREIVQTGVVWLHVWGKGHPVVNVGGESPFMSEEEMKKQAPLQEDQENSLAEIDKQLEELFPDEENE